MAFIGDKNDPQRLGMFSKAGRFSSEQHIIFQRKDEILYNKIRNLKVQKSTFEKETEEENQIITQSTEEQKSIKKKEIQPFKKQLSREYIQQQNASKYPPKPIGYYRIKQKIIDKNPHLIWDYLKAYKQQQQTQREYQQRQEEVKQRSSNSVHQTNQSLETQLNKSTSENFLKKTIGFVELKRQLQRGDSFLKQKNNPHENRFEIIPQIPKKVPTINLKRTKGREDNLIYNNNSYAPEYDPNYDYCKKKLGSSGPTFDKILPRKPLEKKPITHNENYYEIDTQTKSVLYRNPTCPDFNKMLSREKDDKCALPSFMQQHLNSRTQLTCLSYKMLKQNNYFEGRFQNTNSQFQKKKKQQKKQDDSDDSDQSES